MHEVSAAPTATPTGEKVRTTISIDSGVLEQGKTLAREDRRDFSAFLEVTIEEKWEARQVAKKKEVAS